MTADDRPPRWPPLPVTRKSDLLASRPQPPFGGVVATPVGQLARVFVSPGPIYEPEAAAPITGAARAPCSPPGLRAGELCTTCFAYHFTPAGIMLESGARALGCPVFPGRHRQDRDAGRGDRGQLRPRATAARPIFLKIILEKADELGVDLSSLRRGHVSGRCLPARAARLASRRAGWRCCRSYGTADLGLIAYESEAREGLILDEGVIVEIVRPGTGDPVPTGEVGEVVVTTLNPRLPADPLRHRRPLGRAAGRVARAAAPTGASGAGWGAPTRRPRCAACSSPGAGGRDRAPSSARWRRRGWWSRWTASADVMMLRAESAAKPRAGERRGHGAATATKLRGEVELVPPGSLPNDGKVIDDTRPAPA